MEGLIFSPLFAAAHHPLLAMPAGDASLAALRRSLAHGQAPLRQLLREHGAILLRGFALDGGAADMGACARDLGAAPYGYVGGNSPRTRVLQDVHTSTEYPASETISLHNEMSYLPHWPRRLLFFCQTPAGHGGQTSLASGVDVLRSMPEDIVQQLRTRRICYLRHFDPALKLGKSWQQTYQTSDRDELDTILRAQHSSGSWTADGKLTVHTVCDAFTRHPDSGAEVWFNQIEQWHPSALHPKLRALFSARAMLAHDCRFGDGGAMNDAFLARIRHALDQNKLLFDWQKNDLLLIDNVLMMHGREAYTGARSTLAYLSAT